MNPSHRGHHRCTRRRCLPRAARAALDNAATRVSTHLKEERVGLPGRPILVHRALLHFDRLRAPSRSDDNEHNEVTSLIEATGLDIPLNAVHRIASRHPA